MIEGSSGARLLLETRHTVRIRRNAGRQQLQRDITLKPRITCAIDLAHTARADGGDNFVRANSNAGTERHVRRMRES